MNIERGIPMTDGTRILVKETVVPTVRWLIEQGIEFDGPELVDWQKLDYVFYDKSDAFTFMLRFQGTAYAPSP